MDLVPSEDIYKYKRKSKYEEEFNAGLYPWIKQVLKTKEQAVFKEKDMRQWLQINEDTTIYSVYKRMRVVLQRSDLGIKIGTHLDGNRVLIFFWKY